jgi:hypothetical protein
MQRTIVRKAGTPSTGQPSLAQHSINLTEFMHVPCSDLAVEFKARVEHTNGLDMVDTATLEDIRDALNLELFIRRHGESYDFEG